MTLLREASSGSFMLLGTGLISAGFLVRELYNLTNHKIPVWKEMFWKWVFEERQLETYPERRKGRWVYSGPEGGYDVFLVEGEEVSPLRDTRGQDIAEYAVMLAVILVIVIGTVQIIGQNAATVFSQVGSAIQ